MLEHVCFQKEDGTALMVSLTAAGQVDLKKVAGLFHGSTERPLALQMHLCTWSLFSLKNDKCKVTTALLRASTGREGTSKDPFIVRFMDCPTEQKGERCMCRQHICAAHAENVSAEQWSKKCEYGTCRCHAM